VKCTYCQKPLPEANHDGVMMARIKNGIDRAVPVCLTCYKKPALRLEIVAYKKLTDFTD
jgi:hypothetical protein